MQTTSNQILQKGQIVNDFTVVFFIKQGANAQTYRVKGKDSKLYFLKLFNYSKLHRTQFDSDGNLLEIEFLKKINHPNIVKYKDSGEIVIEHQKYAFLVSEFIPGETLADKLVQEHTLNAYDVKQHTQCILNGLNYLHSLPEPVIHNEITIQNVMLVTGESPITKIIDFGYARSFHQSTKAYNREGLNPYYLAPECFYNSFSPQSDIFSVGALMYHLLFGLPPWFKDISKYKADRDKIEEIVVTERNKPLSIPNLNKQDYDLDDNFIKVIKKSLQLDSDLRFQTVQEFLLALNGEVEVEDVVKAKVSLKEAKTNEKDKQFSPKNKVKGFGRIVGMQKLKEQLINDVIDLMNDKEGAEKYGLSMPNGMLLYGPPGCGKTFFAECFAEETGFNYKYVNPSELASIYVHGSQEKIGNLFEEAKKNAPFIICLDEVSSLFPSREKAQHSSQVGEVDEFLTRLNNCGQDGVFVIGLTNFPNIIDSAVKRAGRFDIKAYIPLPDFDARKEMFELYIKDRPKDFGIDYDKLASLTANYVSSDIKLIVDSVAHNLRKSRGKITMPLLAEKINAIKPSVTLDEIKKFEQIKRMFEDGEDDNDFSKRNTIGFKPKN